MVFTTNSSNKHQKSEQVSNFSVEKNNRMVRNGLFWIEDFLKNLPRKQHFSQNLAYGRRQGTQKGEEGE